MSAFEITDEMVRKAATAAVAAIKYNLPVDAFGQGQRLNEYAAIWGNAAGRAVVEAVAPAIQAQALRRAADEFGVYVGSEDGDWWKGYRQAQREAIAKITDLADKAERGAQ